VKDHHMIEEGDQEAAIGAFLMAHEGHTQDVEVQRGAWSIFCRCSRCEDIHTFEVDNEAKEQALGLPPWQEEGRKLRLKTPRPTITAVPRSASVPKTMRGPPVGGILMNGASRIKSSGR
jgi:hypothetical protein